MLAFIGCRTTQRRQARGKGISVYHVSDDGSSWEQLQCYEGLINPSWLVINRRGDRLYCIHGDRSDISAFAVHPVSGELRLLNQVSTGGANPVHMALSADERFIVISNHISSSLAVVAVEDDGSLKGVVDLIELSGKVGPHRIEQPFPKPHANPFTADGRFVVIPDKGLDCLFVMKFDSRHGRLIPCPELTVATREGAGPRHIDFHPSGRLAFVVNELDSTLTAYRFDPDSGQLTPYQVSPSVSPFHTGDNRAAGIVVSPSGSHVLVTNRGEDSISVYRIDPRNDHLQYSHTLPSGGKTPRFMGFDPLGRLHIANEDDDTLCLYTTSSPESLSNPTQRISTPSPVCVAFRED
ncbi:lactonase family protein [Halomonas huangheensis]|uniref:Hemagglutinin n=1 Tax=Halomonas huangheensis TaxID=1178482 RepID=W1N6F2_9GAMM|nr:lactonase family protein [Halomonas huangheensis]ALM51969.1 hypothetical protein AR456_06515 [Halomonas huangheensis]ERL50510.1 hypothetical protein BJB45_05120 [Halomonas huangheensis]